jgi:hypothetical protein
MIKEEALKEEAAKKTIKKILPNFFTTLFIWFLVWLTHGWIFLLIIILPLFFWIKRKRKKKNESKS